MAKIDFKKELKELYQPSKESIFIVQVPDMNFLMVEGKGNPNNSKEFQDAIEVLYSLSFAIKMMPKKGETPKGYFEYVVPPLEGLWWTDGKEFDFKNKDKLRWKIMIMQPGFVTPKVFENAVKIIKEKKNLPALSKVKFESLNEGKCVQILHLGSYSKEPKNIEKMKSFIEENNLVKNGLHHEIYLSDPRKTASNKLKTILRQPVKNK